MNPLKTVEQSPYRIEIHHDNAPLNPREDDCDNATTMWCAHRRYTLGDQGSPRHNEAISVDEIAAEVGGIALIKPLYMYDHSGITIKTTPFSCPWDSGQIGWVFISKPTAERHGIADCDLDNALEAEVKAYDRYLRGEAYGWQLIHIPDDEIVDQCWGYDDDENALKDARFVLEHELKERDNYLARV